MKKYLYLLTIIIIGCRQNNTITAESFDGVEESVTEAYNGLCEIYSGIDVEKILEYYTDDIIRIPPSGQIFAGKESLRVAKTKTRQENYYTLDEYSTPVVLTSVDQAVTYSTFKDTTISKETGDTVRTEGTWVAVWRKQSDHTWKIALSTFTENVK
jgi:ketosteroid isomerase-like protein